MIEKEKHNTIRSALFAVTILLASLTCAKVAQCVIEPKRVEGIVVYATTRNDRDPNGAQPYLDETRKVAKAMKGHNLFIKAPPKQHPVKQVDGILGREVLIANKWYKAGDTIGEAKVLSVEPTQVTIEWNGQTKTFAPLASAQNGPAGEPKRRMEKPETAKVRSATVAAPTDAVKATVTKTAVEVDPLGWMGIDLPPRVREKILEQWNSASEEEKQKAQDQWNSMSDEAKEEAIESMNRHM